MSNDTAVTIRGFVGSIPNLREAASGVFVTSFRIGTTPSRRTKAGEWVDEETMWFTVTVFRDLAKRVSSSVRKGMPVLVRGNLTQESWVGADGQARVSHVLTADTVAVDLSRGQLTWAKDPSARESQEGGAEYVMDVPTARELPDDGVQDSARPREESGGIPDYIDPDELAATVTFTEVDQDSLAPF